MDLENQTNHSADTSATPATEPVTPASQPEPTAQPDASIDPAAQASAAAPAWTPDFKFKVMDKEYEIDEMFRPIIKDEDTLKKVKRMQEQVLGLPHVEQSRDEFKNKYTAAAPRLQEYDRVETRLNRLSHHVANKDFGTFFDELKIPRKEVLAWVKRELDIMEAPPHVREAYEKNRQLQAQQFDLEQQNQQYAQQVQEVETQKFYQHMDQTIATLAGAEANLYNEKMQNPLAFRDYVIAKGQQFQFTTGQKAPLNQIIELAKQELNRLGLAPQPQAPDAQGNPAQPGQPAQAAQPAQNKPAIPVIKAGGASPVSTPVKTMKDLKARAAAL